MDGKAVGGGWSFRGFALQIRRLDPKDDALISAGKFRSLIVSYV